MPCPRNTVRLPCLSSTSTCARRVSSILPCMAPAIGEARTAPASRAARRLRLQSPRRATILTARSSKTISWRRAPLYGVKRCRAPEAHLPWPAVNNPMMKPVNSRPRKGTRATEQVRDTPSAWPAKVLVCIQTQARGNERPQSFSR